MDTISDEIEDTEAIANLMQMACMPTTEIYQKNQFSKYDYKILSGDSDNEPELLQQKQNCEENDKFEEVKFIPNDLNSYPYLVVMEGDNVQVSDKYGSAQKYDISDKVDVTEDLENLMCLANTLPNVIKESAYTITIDEFPNQVQNKSEDIMNKYFNSTNIPMMDLSGTEKETIDKVDITEELENLMCLANASHNYVNQENQ